MADVINRSFNLTTNNQENILKVKFFKIEAIKKMIKKKIMFDGFSLSAINYL